MWWFDWSDCFIIRNYYIDSWDKQFDGTMLSTSVGVNSQCMSAVQCGEDVACARHIPNWTVRPPGPSDTGMVLEPLSDIT